jgi:hypothetical protein
MTKGLQRSLSRGPKTSANIVKESIDLTGKVVTVSAAGAGIGFGSLAISGLAEGNLLVLGLAGTVGFAGSGADANLAATWEGDFGIGTTPADDGTISVGDVDLLASTATGAATAEVIAAQRIAAALAPTMFDNTAGTLEMNFNLLIDAADITDATSVDITLSGRVDIAYIVLSDD